MQRFTIQAPDRFKNTAKAALLLPLAFALSTFAAAAETLPRETVMLEEDQLAVTVASATLSEADPLDSDMTIWVGEIELNGRNTVWVELIDSYGEVIYDSEVNPNETHLLPDGRAVVVRSVHPETRIAKLDESRIARDGALTVTRRVVEDGDRATSVEFIEASAAPRNSSLVEMASVGQTIWDSVIAFFDTAVSKVEVAWAWLVDTIRV